MPLIAHSALPAFARLRSEGREILSPARARPQDFRELHIGFLNMMPDAALEATERQFLRLVGAGNVAANIYVYPFTFAEIPRGPAARAHIKKHYRALSELQAAGLDALILSGANPARDTLAAEPFWRPLTRLVSWARDNVCSVMCSCLAMHAVVKQLWNIDRRRRAQKCWGVFSHRVTAARHPLVAGLPAEFDAPHSHLFGVSAAQFRRAGLRVLAENARGEVHVGASPDGFRFVLLQGHPEYDAISLLKEYRREVARYLTGARADYPPPPHNYLHGAAAACARRYQRQAQADGAADLPEFPEAELAQAVAETWRAAGQAMAHNWLGLLCQIAHPRRGTVFRAGVDAADPLRLRDNL